jgi:hypothetical protein
MKTPYTAQELFTKVRTHLLAQRKKSLNNKGLCAYRGTNGLKCALGCLIADEDYHPKFEGGNIRAETPLRNACGVTDATLSLAGELRRLHDAIEPELWPDRLTAIASRFNVTVEPF